jgi:hypothetical protein
MNIFPTNIQYFLLKHFENNKEILKLYTDPNYKNEELNGYYYPGKTFSEYFEGSCFYNAAESGNIRLMKRLLENGCSLKCGTFGCALRDGNLDNMKWLKANGCPWDSWTFFWAEQHGNLENMKWLKENGCPEI